MVVFDLEPLLALAQTHAKSQPGSKFLSLLR